MNTPKRLRDTLGGLGLSLILSALVAVGVMLCVKTGNARRRLNALPVGIASVLTGQRVVSSAPTLTVSRVTELEKNNSSEAAQVNFNGRQISVSDNVQGEYHRILVPASAVITATVPFTESIGGEVIPVQAEDGGQLQGASAAGVVTVNSEHNVIVDYRASENDGLYRVTLRRGADNRVLEFWVGAEPPVIVRKGGAS